MTCSEVGEPPSQVMALGEDVVLTAGEAAPPMLRADLLPLLVTASEEMGASLDPGQVLRSLAQLVVPTLADWSMITLVGTDGQPDDVESWHRDPRYRKCVQQFAEHRFSGRTERSGSMSTLASGEPFVLLSGARAFAQRTLRSADAIAALERLELEWAVVVPIMDDGRVIGMITLLGGPDRPPLDAEEVEAVVDLARRAAARLTVAQTFERQRSTSEQLQRSMLTEPTGPGDLELVARYVPASEDAQVGGDWYDAFPHPDGGTVLVVADVAGHDIAAAAMMGQLRSMLRGIAVTTASGPADLLSELDRAMEALDLGVCASAVVARVRTTADGARVTWSNAGHPAPLVLGADGVVAQLDSHDVLLGVVPDEARTETDLDLPPGARLVLYTDGLIEHRREDYDTGQAALRGALADLHHLDLDELVDETLDLMVPTRHDDDVAVLAVRPR